MEEGALATGFDVTARAWKVRTSERPRVCASQARLTVHPQSRFGVPYSTCGCPLPSQPPLSRLSAKLGISASARDTFPTSILTTLVPSSEDSDATHPSAHNALVLPDHPQAQRKRAARAAEVDARRRRDDKARRKAGAGEMRDGLPPYEKRAEGLSTRPDAHAYAFLAPVALVPVYYRSAPPLLFANQRS